MSEVLRERARFMAAELEDSEGGSEKAYWWIRKQAAKPCNAKRVEFYALVCEEIEKSAGRSFEIRLCSACDVIGLDHETICPRKPCNERGYVKGGRS